MVTSCANTIRQKAHTGSSQAPVVSEHWANRLSNRYPEHFGWKEKSIEADCLNVSQSDNIRACFTLYKVVGKQMIIEPCEQYNLNEARFRIYIARDK